MENIILQTERLQLRELEQSDFRDLAEMLQDPEVVYAYGHDFTDQDVMIWLERQNMRYQKYGFGLWAVILKSTGAWIGQAGLTMQPYQGSEVLEVGYLFKKKFWHCGYAVEAAKGCKDYAFHQLNKNKVSSIIKADNYASIRVAEKLGMKKEAEFIARYYNGDMLHFLFSVEKDPASAPANGHMGNEPSSPMTFP